jgi:hypothetical protein
MARSCTKLSKLRIHELSIVDAGANEGALAVLMKRDAGPAGPTGEIEMADQTAPTLEDLDKAVKAAADENAKVVAEKAKAEAEVADLRKQLADASAAAAAKAESEKTDLAKRLDAEADRSAKLEKRLAQIEDERELATYVVKAAEFKHLPLSAAELAPALRAISKLDATQAEVITKALSATSEALGKALEALPFVSSAQPVGAEAEWNSLIQKHMAEAKVDEVKATDAVAATAIGKQVYRRMIEEQRPRAN